VKPTLILAAGVLSAQLLAAAQPPTRKAPVCNPATAATAKTSADTDSQPDQKRSKKAKHDKKAKRAEPPMQPDDPRKSPWAEPRDWNWIYSAS
jgi:hypothetical protein